jgi:dTDP-3-amino-3,4,6-trideoxy-alpha-D-glucose transaminase
VLLPHLDEWNNGRRTAAKTYEAEGIAEFVTPQAASPGAEPVFHLYTVGHEEADSVAEALGRAGIEARGYYRTPIHRQPAMLEFAAGAELPGTERVAARNIALPISPVITAAQIRTVVGALAKLPAKLRASA